MPDEPHHLLPAIQSDDALPVSVPELGRVLDQLHIHFSMQRQDAAARAKKIEAALLAASDLIADGHIDPQAARCLVGALLRVVQDQNEQ